MVEWGPGCLVNRANVQRVERSADVAISEFVSVTELNVQEVLSMITISHMLPSGRQVGCHYLGQDFWNLL